MRILSILILAALVIIAGCDRYVPVSYPTEDPPEDLSVPEFTNIDPGQNSLFLSWEIESDTNVSYYRVYHAITETGSFTAHDSTAGLSITIGGLNTSVIHRFAVAPVSKHGIEGYWSRIVTLAPAKVSTGRHDEITD
ncbi:MAG TPA: fibronectin type III domain-containing protein [candidate division Zixibacteria bacterium]|nr:fibronectin type III domain-containing protein [candidate division Zixibacteria bacterium]